MLRCLLTPKSLLAPNGSFTSSETYLRSIEQKRRNEKEWQGRKGYLLLFAALSFFFGQQARSTSVQQLLAILLLLVVPALQAQPTVQPDQQTLQVFVREGCPHCAEAKAYLPTLAARRPQLQIVLRPVDEEPAAMADLLRLSREAGITAPGVPSFLFQNRLLVGFTSPEVSGASIEQLLEPDSSRSSEVKSNLFGTLSVERLG